MITRKLLAALVGISLVAGTLGTASAQTATPTTAQPAGPSDAMAPAVAAKSDTMKKAPIRKHHAHVVSKTYRKHVALRAVNHVATKRTARHHLATKATAGKVALHAGKRIRLSHLVKRGTPKHV